MAVSSDAAAFAARSRVASPARIQVPTEAAGLSRHAEVGSRPVRVAALCSDGRQSLFYASVPAMPAFDGAFLAFARGTLLQSPLGEVAVEDLRPGDQLRTVDGRDTSITWVGSTLYDLRAEDLPLVRVMPDSFGEGRPNGVLTLGPAARILQTPRHIRRRAGHMKVLAPAREFVDSVSVVEIRPPATVELYHIMSDRHAVVQACGLACETYLPDPGALRHLTQEQRLQFLSLFPMKTDPVEFGAPVFPRAVEPGA